MSCLRNSHPGFSTFGEFLRYLRLRAKLTQRELSTATGYSETHIRRLETSRRLPVSASILALFAPALGIETDEPAVCQLIELAESSLSAGPRSAMGALIA